MSRFITPWPDFPDTPLGSVRFGEPDKDPIKFPKQPFDDPNLLAANAIATRQTLNNNGRFATAIFLAGAYSMSLFDSEGNQVRTEPNITGFADSAIPTISILTENFLGSDLTNNVTINLTTFTYVPGINTVAIKINGVDQISGTAYTETSAAVLTLNEPVDDDDLIKVISTEITTNLNAPSGTVTYTSAGAGAVATNANVLFNSREVNPFMFGGVGDGVADDNTALQNALTLVKSINGTLNLLNKTWKFTAKLLIDAPCAIVGHYNGVHNINDTDGAVLLKSGNFDGIEVTSSAGPTFRDFAMVGDAGNGSGGILLTQCGRATLSRLSVEGMAGDGLKYVNGNLSSFRDLFLLGNGTGLNIDGTATPDTNAAVFSNIDARGNTNFGVNINDGWNVKGDFTCQSNGTGIRLDNCRGSSIEIYSENNSTVDIEITNNTNFEGNTLLFLFYGTFTDNQVKPEQNHIIRSLEAADTRTIADYINSKHFRLPAFSGLNGSMDTLHPASAKFSTYFEETGQAQTWELRNTSGLSDKEADAPTLPVYFQMNGGMFSDRLPFTDLDTTPDVSLSQFWLANNTGATTITTFNGGISGMPIKVLFNTGNTTLNHTAFASATGLVLKGGSNKTYAAGEIATFIKNGTDWWIED